MFLGTALERKIVCLIINKSKYLAVYQTCWHLLGTFSAIWQTQTLFSGNNEVGREKVVEEKKKANFPKISYRRRMISFRAPRLRVRNAVDLIPSPYSMMVLSSFFPIQELMDSMLFNSQSIPIKGSFKAREVMGGK
ncbi:hypothetical protein CEXT_132671 [Caerostris extrusa]|uniref:Uncharacterized protein n=1 Tax=Caerostris extrusa TaxID=172846 RepID=A0AAV4PSE5_CAEEX|nr:hypothetical protein CEXT_132671 [Caerostris extrusa]